MSDDPQFDQTGFKNDAYVKKVDKPWGWEYHWVPPDAPYMGKLLHINAGCQFSLQLHDQKRESWFLIDGRAVLIWGNAEGGLTETELEKDKGYSIVPGQKHRIRAITDCNIVEASTPEMGTTWRLEDDYSRPHETPDQRKKERGEV